MPKNPFTDIWEFLTGTTSDHLQLGVWGYVLAALYLALLAAGILIAIRNWREDPVQRTGVHFGTWGTRVLIGTMWFEATLWKLPLPIPGGLKYWTEQEGTRAAFDFHRDFINSVVLPNLHLFAPFVFLAELAFAVSLILGLGVRLASAIGIVFVLQLWLGIYRPGVPHEWPWAYMFLILLMFLFVLYATGRSLGLDAWLRRNVAAVRDGTTLIGRFLRFAG